jgi:hypothetical protein
MMLLPSSRSTARPSGAVKPQAAVDLSSVGQPLVSGHSWPIRLVKVWPQGIRGFQSWVSECSVESVVVAHCGAEHEPAAWKDGRLDPAYPEGWQPAAMPMVLSEWGHQDRHTRGPSSSPGHRCAHLRPANSPTAQPPSTALNCP